jgi:shikimate 5-dehydrogenase
LSGIQGGSQLFNINKDTQICVSLAKKAGNFGTTLHNRAFRSLDLNYIYKACSVDNLKDAVYGIRALGIRGAGVTMPYKKDVLNYIDICDVTASKIGAANTIINNDGILYAYNTDTYSTGIVLSEQDENRSLFVLGNGGFASAVRYSAIRLGIQNIHTITRKEWHKIENIRESVVFNCTPVENLSHLVDTSNVFLDCLTSTPNGARMAVLQATKQFELYTGAKFPIKIVNTDTWKLE